MSWNTADWNAWNAKDRDGNKNSCKERSRWLTRGPEGFQGRVISNASGSRHLPALPDDPPRRTRFGWNIPRAKRFHSSSLSSAPLITINWHSLPTKFFPFSAASGSANACTHIPGDRGLLCMIHRVGMYVMQTTKLVVFTCLVVAHTNFTLRWEDTREIVNHWNLKANHRFFFSIFHLGLTPTIKGNYLHRTCCLSAFGSCCEDCSSSPWPAWCEQV